MESALFSVEMSCRLTTRFLAVLAVFATDTLTLSAISLGFAGGGSLRGLACADAHSSFLLVHR